MAGPGAHWVVPLHTVFAKKIQQHRVRGFVRELFLFSLLCAASALFTCLTEATLNPVLVCFDGLHPSA